MIETLRTLASYIPHILGVLIRSTRAVQRQHHFHTPSLLTLSWQIMAWNLCLLLDLVSGLDDFDEKKTFSQIVLRLSQMLKHLEQATVPQQTEAVSAMLQNLATT